ncbi:MAG: 1-phosphofructokinase [Oscillospiraceae bacterium]|nr:1-phosphofructokinase [Oscillospiraceae bacterium]
MIYTLTVNPAIDYSMSFDKIFSGGMNRSESESVHFGGKGINVSAVLNELGCETTALGFIAGFTGDELERGLLESGIKSDFIRLDSGMTRINLKLTDKDGNETELNAAGPDIPKEKIDELLGKLGSLDENDTLVLAGSLPRHVSQDLYENICEKLFTSRRMRVAADVSGNLIKGIMHFHPWLIKPNHLEAEEICGKKIDSHRSAEECALQLRAMGAMNVIISMADKGAVLAAEDGGVYRLTAPTGKVVCSVGAGDSLLAGFLAGYDATGDLREALRRGVAAGTATAFTDGLCSRQDYEKILSEVRYG